MRRLEDGNLAVPPALDRPMPGKLTLPEEPHLSALVGQIGPYQYVQPVNQLRRDNGWELVYDWGSFSVMRRLRPDAAPPPSLEAVISVAKDASKQLHRSNIWQLHRSNIWQLALLIAPAMRCSGTTATVPDRSFCSPAFCCLFSSTSFLCGCSAVSATNRSPMKNVSPPHLPWHWWKLFCWAALQPAS